MLVEQINSLAIFILSLRESHFMSQPRELDSSCTGSAAVIFALGRDTKTIKKKIL